MNIGEGDLKQDLQQQLILDALRQHGCCRLQVSGTSMLPTLWPGDTVSIENRSLDETAVGDILLYERCGRLFLHRLAAGPTERFPGRLVTRGDSMPHSDPAVRLEAVLGVLAGVRRGRQWAPVPRIASTPSRLAGALLSRSSTLVRWVMRVRGGADAFQGAPSRWRFFFREEVTSGEESPEASAS